MPFRAPGREQRAGDRCRAPARSRRAARSARRNRLSTPLPGAVDAAAALDPGGQRASVRRGPPRHLGRPGPGLSAAAVVGLGVVVAAGPARRSAAGRRRCRRRGWPAASRPGSRENPAMLGVGGRRERPARGARRRRWRSHALSAPPAPPHEFPQPENSAAARTAPSPTSEPLLQDSTVYVAPFAGPAAGGRAHGRQDQARSSGDAAAFMPPAARPRAGAGGRRRWRGRRRTPGPRPRAGGGPPRGRRARCRRPCRRTSGRGARPPGPHG